MSKHRPGLVLGPTDIEIAAIVSRFIAVRDQVLGADVASVQVLLDPHESIGAALLEARRSPRIRRMVVGDPDRLALAGAYVDLQAFVDPDEAAAVNLVQHHRATAEGEFPDSLVSLSSLTYQRVREAKANAIGELTSVRRDASSLQWATIGQGVAMLGDLRLVGRLGALFGPVLPLVLSAPVAGITAVLFRPGATDGAFGAIGPAIVGFLAAAVTFVALFFAMLLLEFNGSAYAQRESLAYRLVGALLILGPLFAAIAATLLAPTFDLAALLGVVVAAVALAAWRLRSH